MDRQQFAQRLIALNNETLLKLERCLVLFELKLQKAEAKGVVVGLRDFSSFPVILKRILDVARDADLLVTGGENNEGAGGLDSEALRRLLLEKD